MVEHPAGSELAVTATSCGFICYRDFGECKHGTIFFTGVLWLISLNILIYTLEVFRASILCECKQISIRWVEA